MGQKTHPIGLRLGIIRSWDSNWYDEKSFAGKLEEDRTIRNYVRNRLKKAGISRILIERTPKRAVITINTSRPGIVIGRSGKEISQLEEELKKITNKEVKILINEIKRPELDAFLVAENIAQQQLIGGAGFDAPGGERVGRAGGQVEGLRIGGRPRRKRGEDRAFQPE